MKFYQPDADVYVPDAAALGPALARTSHLAIGAHQDDLEIMAYDGIIACFQRSDRWFTGVVVTNGAGSARSGPYAQYTDAEMIAIRRREQRKAALVGDYAAMLQLDFPSGAVKDPEDTRPIEDLAAILDAARPEIVYTHNLADKHETHIGVALKTIAALRRLPPAAQPVRLYGCEVWRDLDWLLDDDKIPLDVSAGESLQSALLGVFDSQIAGGKRYDLATLGRRRAHATYHQSHATDAATGLTFAMDLTPLISNPALDPGAYIADFLQRFTDDVAARLRRLGA